MIAASPSPHQPVQLCLDLVTRPCRPGRSPRSAPRAYWDYVDLADVGGELRARGPNARAAIASAQSTAGVWTATFDLLLCRGGTSGTTKPQETRGDAITSAAYAIALYCRTVASDATCGRVDVRAAREVLRWLTELDVL